MEIQKRDQEILALSAKMKTLEEQHSDYQRHITVLKESLCAKEEHYNMLQADVSAPSVFRNSYFGQTLTSLPFIQRDAAPVVYTQFPPIQTPTRNGQRSVWEDYS